MNLVGDRAGRPPAFGGAHARAAVSRQRNGGACRHAASRPSRLLAHRCSFFATVIALALAYGCLSFKCRSADQSGAIAAPLGNQGGAVRAARCGALSHLQRGAMRCSTPSGSIHDGECCTMSSCGAKSGGRIELGACGHRDLFEGRRPSGDAFRHLVQRPPLRRRARPQRFPRHRIPRTWHSRFRRYRPTSSGHRTPIPNPRATYGERGALHPTSLSYRPAPRVR